MEPEGRRGQEAAVFVPTTSLMLPNSSQKLVIVPEVSHEDSYNSSETPKTKAAITPLRPAATSYQNTTTSSCYYDGSSTSSDEDIRNMRLDDDILREEIEDSLSSSRNHNILHSDSAINIPSPTVSPIKPAPKVREAPPTHKSNATKIDEMNQKALSLVKREEYEDAIALFHKVLELSIQTYGVVHASTAAAYHNLGTVHAKRAHKFATVMPDSLQQRHCRKLALENFQAAARTARDALHPNHPNVAVSLVRVGFLLLQSRQYSNAITTFQEALRIRLAAFGPSHGLVANLYNNLGVCSMHMGKFEEGQTYLENALLIQRDIVNQDQQQPLHSNSNNQARVVHQLELADTLFNVGGLCLEWIRRQGPDARRAKQAEDAFAEALEIRKKVLLPDDPTIAQVQGLFEMTRAMPRPRVTAHRSRPQPVKGGTPSSSRGMAKSISKIPPPITTASMITPATTTTTTATTATTLSSFSTSPPPQISNAKNLGKPSKAVVTPETMKPGQDGSIFRAPPATTASSMASPPSFTSSKRRRAVDKPPPLLHITVSREEVDDDDENHKIPRRNKNMSREEHESISPRIFMAPHKIKMTAGRQKGLDGSNDAIMDEVDVSSSFQVDVSSEAHNLTLDQKQRTPTYSYDVEENCLINDLGVDCDLGRIHYPHVWNKAGIIQPDHQQAGGRSGDSVCSRDIMVAQPFYHQYRGSSGAPARNGRTKSKEMSAGNLLSSSMSSERLGGEILNVSTGNKDRDDVLLRAKAILRAHGNLNDEGHEDDTDEEIHDAYDGNRREHADDLPPNFDHDSVLEESIAPLGGNWDNRHSSKRGNVAKTLADMLRDPMNNVRGIHEEGSRQMKKGNYIDAQNLFEVVLQCQQRRHGPLHPDVAAALHNVGIALLRVQNYTEALKVFEEAARVRKGSLGKEHPLVAVSLVKVGITLLLLRRFDEALWSFREALSVRKHALGALHPSTARIYNNIGCVYVEFNEFREARRAFEAALDTQRNALCYDPDSGPLMFGTATTLCNLGYLYRYRDMHAKAAAVLKEAVELQERVLGRSHATVLSTLDSLADSCANSGNSNDALMYYDEIAKRLFREGGKSSKNRRAEAVLLYKISRVHRHRNDLASQLESLKWALQSVRGSTETDKIQGNSLDTLERRILYDIRACREQFERQGKKWT
jgi:tetratricopeptide (TPR) repeat protein